MGTTDDTRNGDDRSVWQVRLDRLRPARLAELEQEVARLRCQLAARDRRIETLEGTISVMVAAAQAGMARVAVAEWRRQVPRPPCPPGRR